MESIFISYNGALEPLLQSQCIPYLKGLSKEGIKLTLISFEKPFDLKYSEKVNKLDNDLKNYDIDWHYFKYHKNPPILSTIFDIIICCGFCFYLSLKKKIKIVHARSYIPAVVGYILKHCFDIKFIFDMRGMMADEYADANIIRKDGFIYRFIKILEKKFLLSADEVVVLTHEIKKEISRFDYAKKHKVSISVVPCCVDLEKFNLLLHKDSSLIVPDAEKLRNKFIFIYVGSLGTWYELDGIYSFFRKAKEYVDNAHLLILTQQCGFANSKIKKNNLDSLHVTILYAEHENVPYYLSKANVGLVFYKPGYSRKGCSPIKVGEYLACGLPLIINEGIGDMSQIVAKNEIGAIISDFNNSEYIKAINKIKELRENLVVLRQRCRAVAENYFSLENGIKRYSEIYSNLIEE